MDDGDRDDRDGGERPGTVLPLDPAPDGMELKHLRSFVAVAEELNFGRAATRLYLSQPALSRQIRALERHIGCDLLRRSTHRVELTVAGEALLDRARRVLHDVDDAVTATRAVGGEIETRLARFWEPIIDLTSTGPDLQTLRNSCDEVHSRFPVPDVEVRPANAGGVPSLLLAPAGRRQATVLFLHGGGYVMGSAFGYRHLAGALALAADTAVILPEYRLAPEHPFPAALEDAVRAYRWLLAEGTPPEQIVLAGDSAGAGLVLSLLLTLRGDREPLPGGAALLSPGLRLTYPDDMPVEELAPGVSLEQLRSFGDSYLAGHPADDPIVDPLNADLHGLPPLLVQGATGDVVVEDSHRLAERARSHGVAVELQLYPVDTHDFQIFWSFLPEAAAALDRAGRFAQEVRAAGADRPAAARPS